MVAHAALTMPFGYKSPFYRRCYERFAPSGTSRLYCGIVCSRGPMMKVAMEDENDVKENENGKKRPSGPS